MTSSADTSSASPEPGPSATLSRNRLGLLEAGRAAAAIAVVLFHLDSIVSAHVHGAPTFPLFAVGERGVDFFFVLSGFIITFVHARDVGRRDRMVNFVRRRFVRIYPLLWLVVSANVAMNIAIDHEIYPFAKLWTSFTLWPSMIWPSPAGSWTLRHEMLFYSLFAVAILSRRWGFAVAGAWLAGTLLQTGLLMIGGSLPGLSAMVFSPLNFQFAAGCCAAWAFGRFGGRYGWQCLVVGSLALVLLVAASFEFGLLSRHTLDYQYSHGVWVNLGFAVVFGLIVYGLAQASQRVAVPRAILLLGAASYALYLVQPPVLGFVGRFLTLVVPPGFIRLGGGHLALFLIAIGAGVAAHLIFEKPLTKIINQRLFGEGRRGNAGATARDMAR